MAKRPLESTHTDTHSGGIFIIPENVNPVSEIDAISSLEMKMLYLNKVGPRSPHFMPYVRETFRDCSRLAKTSLQLPEWLRLHEVLAFIESTLFQLEPTDEIRSLQASAKNSLDAIDEMLALARAEQVARLSSILPSGILKQQDHTARETN